jgi:ubiquinone/menaquinone biosynthesis C-methylase UbiE
MIFQIQNMNLDEAWKTIYDTRAKRQIPEYLKGNWSKEGYEQLLDITLKLCTQQTQCHTVLDVGCGIGRYCEHLQKLGFNPTGVDIAPNMIEFAKAQFPTISFAVANGYDLPFKDCEFDLVISIGALQCLEDYERFVSELCRVAKYTIIISTLYNKIQTNLKEELAQKLKEYEYPSREYHPNHLIPLFTKAGFTVEIITECEGKEITDGYFIIAKRG